MPGGHVCERPWVVVLLNAYAEQTHAALLDSPLQIALRLSAAVQGCQIVPLYLVPELGAQLISPVHGDSPLKAQNLKSVHFLNKVIHVFSSLNGYFYFQGQEGPDSKAFLFHLGGWEPVKPGECL